jgi:hypothetical protein
VPDNQPTATSTGAFGAIDRIEQDRLAIHQNDIGQMQAERRFQSSQAPQLLRLPAAPLPAAHEPLRRGGPPPIRGARLRDQASLIPNRCAALPPRIAAFCLSDRVVVAKTWSTGCSSQGIG